MKDGELKEIKAGCTWSAFNHDVFKVEAERVDADTPIVILSIPLGISQVRLTDVEALDLIDRLQRALDALPSSK